MPRYEDEEVWELHDPTNVVDKLPKDFSEQVKSKKWTERKEALEGLKTLLTTHPRLDPQGNYGEIVSELSHVISKDANINVVAVAGYCLAGIANGLRKKFTPFSLSVLPVILNKFKEKKPVVVNALVEAIDAVGKTIANLEVAMEDLLSALSNKSPGVKIQTSYFLQRHLKELDQKTLPKKVLKAVTEQLIKNIQEADPEIRECAAAALGSAMKAVGEKPMMVLLAPIQEDAAKIEKIKSYCSKAAEEMKAREAASQKASTSNGHSATETTGGNADEVFEEEEIEMEVEVEEAEADPWEFHDPTNILDKMPNNFSEQLKSPKWLERKEVLEQLKTILTSHPRLDPAGNYGELINELSNTVNKDNNINVVSVAAYCMAGVANGLRKKFTPFSLSVFPILLNKFKEKKPVVTNALIEAVDAVGKTLKDLEVAMEDILAALVNKSPTVRIQTTYFLQRSLRVLDQKTLPKKVLKSVTEQLLKNIEVSDPEVRESAAAALGSAMKAVGEKPMMVLLAPIAEDTIKMEKIKSYCAAAEEATKKKTVKKIIKKTVKSSKGKTGGGGGGTVGTVIGEGGVAVPPPEPEVDPWDMYDPVDILSKMPSDFYEQIQSKKWLERKEALEKVRDLLKANPRLEPGASYGELVNALCNLVAKDANINVVAVAAQCVGGIASGLRKKFAPFVLTAVPPILEKFKEKKQVAITAMTEAIDAVGSTAPLDSYVDDVMAALSNKSPGIKIQTSLFLQRTLREMTQKQLPKKVLKPLAEQLVKNITESDPEVREGAAAALGSAMKAIGEKPMLVFLAPIIEDSIKMEKIKEYCAKAQKDFPNVMVASMVQSLHKTREEEETVQQPPPAAKSKKPPEGSPSKSKAKEATKKEPSKAAAAKASSNNDKEKTGPLSASIIDSLEDGSSTARSGSSVVSLNRVGRGRSSNRKAGESLKKKDIDEGFEGGALINTQERELRFKEEKSLKILKWNFSVPDEEHIEQLKGQLSTVCKPALHTQLFHYDFKQHLKAIDALISSLEQCPDACIGATDLLLKWCTLRFFDTNPSVLMKVLEFILQLFHLLTENDLRLHDMEANAFVPLFLTKAGESKEGIKQNIKAILDRLCDLYPVPKLFPIILEATKSKNSKQKAVCLDHLASMVEVYGVEICGSSPAQALKQVAANIGDRDSNVRNAALGVMVAAFMYLGERVYKMVASIGNKEMAMLEERIKRTTKNRPVIKKPPPESEKKIVSGGRKIRPGTATPKGRGSGRATPTNNRPEDSGPMEVTEDGESEEEPEMGRTMVRPQIKRGKYHLDDEDYDMSVFQKDPRKVDLIPHDEVDEIMSLPIPKPVVRTRGVSPSKRRGSTSSVTSIMSMDASMALDTCISQITSPTISTAIQALAQLNELINDSMRCDLLRKKVDQVLVAVYFQFRMAFNTHMADSETDKTKVIELYRNLVNMLLSLLNCGDLPKEASVGPLKDLSCQLLTVLLDERLQGAPDGSQVIRSINVLTVKLVEKSDQTTCLIAFMQLLRETLKNPTGDAKFKELVLKCIWKHCRNLTPNAFSVQAGKIIEEAQLFYEDFPPRSWQRNEDTPMRTIKTILFSLAKGMGDKVLDHVGGIKDWQNAEAVHYLQKSLRDLAKQNGGVVPVMEPPPSAQPASSVLSESTNKSQTPTISESVSSDSSASKSEMIKAIGDIFKTIADKENSKKGIRQLYDYLEQNPTADIAPYMGKSTQFFQNYVKRGLAQVAKERQGQMQGSAEEVKSARGQSRNGNNAQTELSSTVARGYLEKLQALREKAGLSQAEVSVKNKATNETDLPAVNTPSGDRARSVVRQEEVPGSDEAPRSVPDNLNDLKRRLELIKRGSLQS